MKNDITEQLETIIDSHSLSHVVAGLILICEQKAEHLRTNWQDDSMAKTWDRDARLLDRILTRLGN